MQLTHVILVYMYIKYIKFSIKLVCSLRHKPLLEDAQTRTYNERITEVKISTFIPLVFWTTSGMGKEATAFTSD